ncbi:MAG: hypothetical protein Kow006_31000 [Gammaproteobacteria bacterium]
MSDESEKELLRQVRESLDRSVDQLPAEVRSRLAQARHRAVAKSRRTPAGRLYPWLLPAGGFAGVLLTVALWQGTAPIQLPESEIAVGGEMLLSAEELEVVEELDFLLWLERQNDAG